MFRKLHWWIVLLSVGLMPAGGTARAQDYALPDPNLPFPLGSTRPEDGGFFVNMGFAMYRQTNPLNGQAVAYRGLMDFDGSITAIFNPTATFGGRVFYGNGQKALDVQQVSGPNGYSPGFTVDLGWKFGDNSAITFSWLYLFNQRKTAVATLVPPEFDVGADLANTFLFSPVFNFPPEYAGPVDVPNTSTSGTGDGVRAFGVWNGAEVMTLAYEQKFQQLEMTFRETIYQSECFRLNGVVGPRFAWFWERLKWTTIDYDFVGATDPTWVGIYTNIISNRMYGAHAGFQSEYYLGHGFACMLDGQGALYLNVVKKRAKYELGAKWAPPANKRALTDYTVAAELQATAALMWYPTEGIQMKIGYDLMAFFNTVSMKEAIDFNYSALTPEYTQGRIRFLDGIQASIALSF